MNRTIYPPLHTEAHRRLKEQVIRDAHAARREAVNDWIDDGIRALRRWGAIASLYLRAPKAGRLG